MKLTQAAVQRLAIPKGKSEKIHFDDEVPGFGVRLREGGSRVWICQYKIGSKQRRVTLGSFGVLHASKARSTARDLLAKVRLGHDPANDKATARIAASETFGVMVGRFLKRQQSHLRPRGYSETQRYLEKYLKPLHSIAIQKVSRSMVASRLGAIADKHGAVSADRARASLSALFAWAIREGLCENNPVIGTNKAVAKPQSRDRVLNDTELKSIWHGLPASDYGRILKLLILTGCRREEIASLRWSEVSRDGRMLALPGNRTKNHRSVDVPLSELALAILSECPRRFGRDLVFGSGRGGYQGWSKAKAELEVLLPNITDWRLHDIRRTVATGMADLGVQPHVIEAVLNHVSGHKSGVAGIYNRSVYAAEKTTALALWAEHVCSVTQGRTSNITPIRAAVI